MKKVLLISLNFYPEIGSAANRAKNIYLLLKKEGHSVNVLTCEPGYPNQSLYEKPDFWYEDEVDEKDVIRIKLRARKYSTSIANRLFFYFKSMFMLMKTIFRQEQEYDVVFCTIPPLFSAFAGMLAKWKFKAILITDIRDMSTVSLRGTNLFSNKVIVSLAHRVEMHMVKISDHVIINSEGFRDIIKNDFPDKELVYMPNSLSKEELAQFKPFDDEPTGPVKVIYTGNIGLAQNIQKLFDIATHLQENSSICFEIIGYGFHKNSIVQQIKESAMRNIAFCGALNRRETLGKVAEADIAFVSLVDVHFFDTVLPGKEIDYMGMGTPILGDISGNSKAIVEKAGSGLIPSDRSVKGISEALLQLAENQALRKQLGENGHEFAKAHFNWEINIQKLLHLLED